MGTCYLNKISSGVSLNFKVVSYTSVEKLKIATPSENTIGVVTDIHITGWYFSPVEPKSPVTGMVWIKTGDSGLCSFNALKKNGIVVYPLSAHQYLTDEWCDRTAKLYQGGSWLDWGEEKTDIFEDGDQNIDITGGWTNVDPTEETLSLSYSAESDDWASVETSTVKAVDVTDFSKLVVNVDSYEEQFYVYLRNETGEDVASVNASAPGEMTVNLANLTGSYFIVLKAQSASHGGSVGTHFTVSKVQLMK